MKGYQEWTIQRHIQHAMLDTRHNENKQHKTNNTTQKTTIMSNTDSTSSLILF